MKIDCEPLPPLPTSHKSIISIHKVISKLKDGTAKFTEETTDNGFKSILFQCIDFKEFEAAKTLIDIMKNHPAYE